jgi:predicted dehydrogenase
MNGVIVGFGEVARNGHWPAYESSSETTIVAIVDRAAERRELAARLMPNIATYSTLDEVPASIQLDFVDICTPPALHLDPMLTALGRGCHVLCEKPFLLDSALVDLVRERAAAAALAVVPVHNWKYAPILREATVLVRSGAIGELERAEIQTSRVRAAATAEAGRPNWRRDPAIAGGGILMDHGWHAVYLALGWFGQSSSRIHASFQRPPDGVEAEAHLSITFPRGEALIDLTWNGETRNNFVRLTGSRGEIVVADDTLHLRSARVMSTTFPTALSNGSHHPDWFAAMLPDVVSWFRNPTLARPAFDEAAACLSIIHQAYGSDCSVAVQT